MDVLGKTEVWDRELPAFLEHLLCSPPSFQLPSSRASLKPHCTVLFQVLCPIDPSVPLPLLPTSTELSFTLALATASLIMGVALFVHMCVSGSWQRPEVLASGLPQATHPINSFTIELGKVFKFKCYRVFFAKGNVSYSGPLALYSVLRATWARSTWILTKPSLPQAQSPVFILQQLEANRLLPRQVNISDQLEQSPCSNVPGARTSTA